jgi:hypothetical protein
VHDHGEPVGRVDHGDQTDQRGDLVVVIVLAYLGPGLVGHAVVGVGEPGALARSDASSWMDFGSGDCAITRLALANRLENLAAISLPNMLKRVP